jgi:DNA-directed RNA polymerase alpha subunit
MEVRSMEVKRTKEETPSDFPKRLAAPARRALHAANIRNLAELANKSEADIVRLHGIGPNAIKQLKVALKAKGMSFR